MAVPNKRGPLIHAICVLLLCASGVPARADEIRLKSGRKLNGVIVAYKDDMFKVKTDDGYELIRKDKIEAIIPSTPAGKEETPAAKKDASQHSGKPGADGQPKAEPAVASSSDTAAVTNASAKSADPGKTDQTAPKVTITALKPG
ncbi:MAG TPA: hypothetical protein VN454_04440, partial [Candidatus Angelobacter sp.]|nr:hypothetical protein [Candidatus Angelobacter sp.]